jgi:hypothetical protein
VTFQILRDSRAITISRIDWRAPVEDLQFTGHLPLFRSAHSVENYHVDQVSDVVAGLELGLSVGDIHQHVKYLGFMMLLLQYDPL